MKKDGRLVSKMEGKTNCSMRLKQFDGLTWLTLSWPPTLFYDWSTPLRHYGITARYFFHKRVRPSYCAYRWESGVYAACLVYHLLPHDAMRKRDTCRRPVSVCPSVTLVYCVKNDPPPAPLKLRPYGAV